jgi:hypothetical protein
MVRKIALVLVGAAVASFGILTVTLTSASAITQPVTIHLTESPVQESELDFGAPGDSQGDQRIFTVIVVDEDTNETGTGNGHCTLTNVQKDLWVCVEIFKLKRGIITIEGVNPVFDEGTQRNETRTSAVTGGTGRYQNVRGQATELGGGHEEEIVLTLIP